ncbi:DUF1016 domain-containing protein, partial [bacterium]|nr:DUF1016 domain-containing protein [bacterium]
MATGCGQIVSILSIVYRPASRGIFGRDQCLSRSECPTFAPAGAGLSRHLPEHGTRLMHVPMPVGYNEMLSEIKSQIQSARIRAVTAVNGELIILYWQIGREILIRKQAQDWHDGAVPLLAADLKR